MSAPPDPMTGPPMVALDDVLAIIDQHQGAMRTALLSRDVIIQALDRCGGNHQPKA